MLPISSLATVLDGVGIGLLPMMLCAGALVAGLAILYHGLMPLEPLLGPRVHRMIGGAAMGLFAAWLTLSALWLLAPAGL